MLEPFYISCKVGKLITEVLCAGPAKLSAAITSFNPSPAFKVTDTPVDDLIVESFVNVSWAFVLLCQHLLHFDSLSQSF